jgi:hypothetical protein
MQLGIGATARRTAGLARGNRSAVCPRDARVLRLPQEGRLSLGFAAAGVGLDALSRRLGLRTLSRRPGRKGRPWGRADEATPRRGAVRWGRERTRGRDERVRVAARAVGGRASRERGPAGGGRRRGRGRRCWLSWRRGGRRRGRRRGLEGVLLQAGSERRAVAEPAAADPPPGEGRKEEAEPAPSSPSRRAAMAGPSSAR